MHERKTTKQSVSHLYTENAQVMYQLPALDSEGTVRHFEKPLFLTCMMFVAMMFALPIYYIQQASWAVRR